MTFGERIAVTRKEKGISQKEMSAALGVTPTCLNYWEKDKRFPSVPMLNRISEILGVDGDYLLGREKQKENSPAPERTGTREFSLEETDKLLVALGFIKEGEQLTDDDLMFLEGIVRLLDAWFKRK